MCVCVWVVGGDSKLLPFKHHRQWRSQVRASNDRLSLAFVLVTIIEVLGPCYLNEPSPSPPTHSFFSIQIGFPCKGKKYHFSNQELLQFQ